MFNCVGGRGKSLFPLKSSAPLVAIGAVVAHGVLQQTTFIHQYLKESQAFVLPDGLFMLSVFLDAAYVHASALTFV